MLESDRSVGTDRLIAFQAGSMGQKGAAVIVADDDSPGHCLIGQNKCHRHQMCVPLFDQRASSGPIEIRGNSLTPISETIDRRGQQPAIRALRQRSNPVPGTLSVAKRE